MEHPRPRHAARLARAAAGASIGALALLGALRSTPIGERVATALTAAWSGTGRPTSMTQRAHTNRLAREKSPYLLQHAANPVDWYPWGEEAFEKARRENKPIFLSIGYSTCHWCHVMERESFENEQVAELLNRWFVPIKVDREERPDVDRIYMRAMQALGMGGGWPLNAFLTPDLEPFYGGTYFPPDSMLGRPGMLQVLPRVHEAWTTRREQLVETGGRVLAALSTSSEPEGAETELEPLLANGASQLARMHDPEYGGFGNTPKFPSTVNLDFLVRWYARDPERNAEARTMVERQLDAMMRGGIHDHLGGGFHRYATQRTWRVPHFEKMLYDQAQIAWAYLEGYQVTGNAGYAETARGVFRYVERDLSSPEGGFDSAEDADSEGEEGKFYVWRPAEIEGVLGRADAALFAFRYGVTPKGNFEHGTTILEEAHSLEATAAHAGRTIDETRKRLERASARLLEARSKRVRPHRDDKVLAAWNGLMISAFARGARVLGEPALADRAARAAEFVWTRLRDPRSGELKRRWREGEAEGAGQLDDYADFALGCLDLYAATFDPRWLERAEQVMAEQIRRFWDPVDGGFFESPAGDPSIKVRMKDDFDGAEIAGNSIAAWNLQVLAALLDRPEWRELSRRQLDYYARRLASQPVAMPRMLVAMELARSTPRHVVVAGRPEAADTRALIAQFDKRFLPHDRLLLADPGRPQALAELVPFTSSLTPRHGKATAYVCVDYACRLPTSDPDAFGRQLDEREPHPVAAAR